VAWSALLASFVCARFARCQSAARADPGPESFWTSSPKFCSARGVVLESVPGLSVFLPLWPELQPRSVAARRKQHSLELALYDYVTDAEPSPGSRRMKKKESRFESMVDAPYG
jgi:hypothetical protein